jgi:acetylglutamate kinase
MVIIDNQHRVSVISEALPYIRNFAGKTFVIKYGGASMTNDILKQKVIEDIALLNYIGVSPVIVHGGGPEINNMLERLNIKSQFHQGLRVTDKDTIEIVEMVLNGKVQKELVGLLNQAGAKAIGLCGRDGNLMKAKKFSSDDDGFDWGFTGEIDSINPQVLYDLIEKKYLPLISSLAPDELGQIYNINADIVAAQIAIALKAEKLILLTDTPGILRDKDNKNSLIKSLNTESAKSLIEDKTITDGMIPKVLSGINAINNGVGAVHILDGTHEHVLLLEIFSSAGVGSMLIK